MGTGMGSLALASLLGEQAGAIPDNRTTQRPIAPTTHFPPRAKRVVQIFCPGAVSQMDTFEYKPELTRRHDQPMPGLTGASSFQGGNGNLMRSPWEFKRHGKCGKWVSDLLPHLAECVDDIAFIHSLTARSNTHGPAMCQMNTGFVVEGFPSAGAWVLPSSATTGITSRTLDDVNTSSAAAIRASELGRGIPARGIPGDRVQQ